MTKALVVDDSRAMRMILSKSLAGLGFQVVQAIDGEEAIRTMEREGESFGLLLVDWNMPVVSGLDVVRWVRGRPLYSGVRLMMVTTETEIEQMTEALEAGADEYLMKPFTVEAVEDKLRLLGVIS